MANRLDYYKASPAVMQAMLALEKAAEAVSLPAPLRELVKMRVSQINGCAYCLDLHAPAARRAGVPQQQLDVLAAWPESAAFSKLERAALGWAEALTRLEANGASDQDFNALSDAFTAQEQVELTLVINTINAWNRFAVGFRAQHPVRIAA